MKISDRIVAILRYGLAGIYAFVSFAALVNWADGHSMKLQDEELPFLILLLALTIVALLLPRTTRELIEIIFLSLHRRRLEEERKIKDLTSSDKNH